MRMGGEEQWRRVVWVVFVRGSWQVFELFACLFLLEAKDRLVRIRSEM